MRRLSRIVVAVVLLVASVGMLQVASSVWAQPPGFDKGKGFDKDFEKGFDKGKGFEKGKGVDRQTDKSRTPPSTTDPVKSLEDDLAKLKALEADILAQLKKLKEAPAAPAPAPVAGPDRRGPGGFGPGNGGPGGFGPGGFGPGGFGFRGPGGEGGMPRGMPWLAQGITRAFQSMSADQLKEVIGELEKLRVEKLRAAAPTPRPMERSGRPEGRPEPGSQNDEILKRLDRLSQELDDIRKSLKR
jgi:hypothetical protein